jgi:DNA-directed RNA polymerase subunit RPC12/RpoP
MSLICVKCGKIIVMSEHPDHYACCAACGPEVTDDQRRKIEESAASFRAAAKEAEQWH